MIFQHDWTTVAELTSHFVQLVNCLPTIFSELLKQFQLQLGIFIKIEPYQFQSLF